ncbi:MAG: apolipoprotein N-acyltransferase [Candidatus Niyogibacteria bacterium]|nr:apolipoprotein N-acyltransferase [Candidatus Niyogibacteria bacterium]
MRFQWVKKIAIVPVFSALALLVSFNYPVFWWLGFLAIAPFIGWIYQAENAKKVFIGGLVFGLIFMGGVISWFWNAYPLNWVGINSASAAIALIFFIWSLSSAVFAVFIALWAAVFWKYKRNTVADLFIAPFLWVIFEYARSFAFSIFWAGPGALYGAHWSMGFLGYILTANTALLQLAGFGGIYFLSFVVILSNILIYGVWRLGRNGFFSLLKNKIIFVFAILFIAAILSGLNYLSVKSASPRERMVAALVTTNVPATFGVSFEGRGAKLEQLYGLLDKERNGLQNTDLLVFPEHSGFIGALGSPSLLFLKMFLGEDEKLVIDSLPAKSTNQEGVYSRMVYLNTEKPNEAVNNYYDKLFLMPHGEYLPWLTEIAARAVGYSKWAQDFTRNRGFSGGSGISSLGEFRGIKVGALFCSETISPLLYRELTSKGAEVLVSVSSYAVFHGSPLHFRQILAMAKVRAVENNRYYLQASNFAPSYMLDNHGRLLKSSVRGQDAIIYGEVGVITKKSFYNVLLDLF